MLEQFGSIYREAETRTKKANARPRRHWQDLSTAAGKLGAGNVQGSFAYKIPTCSRCDFYMRISGKEISYSLSN
jgi:hypothetical protein